MASYISRRAFIASAIGLGGVAYLVNARVQPSRPGSWEAYPEVAAGTLVSIATFGAVPDDESRADSNLEALNVASRYAAHYDAILQIPPGTWYVTANQGAETGWVVDAGINGRCRIRGGGRSSVIKRAATAHAAPSSSMVWMRVDGGGEVYEVQGVCFDGNEANFPIVPGKSLEQVFAHEQSANLSLASRRDRLDKVAAASVTLRDVYFTGCVGDGFKIGAQCANMVIDGFQAWGRTRRVRSDIEFSRIPVAAYVSNATLDAFETEPSAVDPKAVLHLKDIHARTTFDLVGNKDDPQNYLEVQAVNVTQDMDLSGSAPNPKCDWYRIKGSFTGGRFRTGPATFSEKRMGSVRQCRLRFDGAEFTAGHVPASASAAAPFVVRNDYDGDFVDFVDCSFRAAPGVSSGHYLSAVRARPAAGQRHVRLTGCASDGALPYVVQAEEGATLVIDGGALKARTAIVDAAAGDAADLKLSRQSQWQAPRIVARGTLPPRN